MATTSVAQQSARHAGCTPRCAHDLLRRPRHSGSKCPPTLLTIRQLDDRRWLRWILNSPRRSFKLRVLVDRQRPMKNVTLDRTTVLQLDADGTDGALDAAADCNALRNDVALDLCAIADQEIRGAQLAFDSPHDFGRICRRVSILLGCAVLHAVQHVHLLFRQYEGAMRESGRLFDAAPKLQCLERRGPQ